MSANERDATRIGAYILGLSNPEDEAQIERELAEDEALRDVYAVLASQLQQLADTADPVEPSPQVWQNIEARLEEIGQPAKPPPATLVHLPARALPRPANDGFWRGFGMAAMVASLVVGLFFSQPDWRRFLVPEPVVIAILLDENQEPGAIVEAFDGQHVRIVPLRDFDIPQDRTMQVWTKPSEEIGPVSLGLLPVAAQQRLQGPELPIPSDEQLYEVTLEPAQGSPTGKPTGPILLKGFAKIPR